MKSFPQNDRLSDDKEFPEIRVISGVILFGKAFENLCSEKGDYGDSFAISHFILLSFHLSDAVKIETALNFDSTIIYYNCREEE